MTAFTHGLAQLYLYKRYGTWSYDPGKGSHATMRRNLAAALRALCDGGAS